MSEASQACTDPNATLTMTAGPQTESSPLSISSAADSRAKTSRSPAMGQDSRESAPVYGGITLDWFASFDRGSWSSKTLLLFSHGASEQFLGTWPKRGMMRSGRAYELPMLARHTDESGSSWWPTPTEKDSNGSARMTCIRTKEWTSNPGTTLTDAVRLAAAGLPLNKIAPGLKGQVNPEWSEALMGFPVGWSCPEDGQIPTVVAKKRGSRRASSKG